MEIKNTSRYPTSVVDSLVLFAVENCDTAGIEVHVKNSKQVFAGRAWHDIRNNRVIKVSEDIDDLIIVRIGSPDKFPITFSYPKLKTAPTYTIKNWKESIITVTAHEMYHIYQIREKKRLSEVQAEIWSLNRLLKYRGSCFLPQENNP